MDWDLPLLQHINQHWAHPVLDWLMPALSAIDAWLPLLVVVALLVLWRGGKQGRLMLVCIALAIGIGDGVVSNILKKTVGRVRPRDAVSGLRVSDLGPGTPAFTRLWQPPLVRTSQATAHTRGKSFPSSHTLNMFAFATVAAMFHRRWGALIYLLAAAVALSRLYVAAHWPSDIAPSMAMGVLIGLGVVTLARKFARNRTAL